MICLQERSYQEARGLLSISMKPKKYILKKYVMAHNAAEALRLDASTPVRDVWTEDTDDATEKPSAIGFQVEVKEDWDLNDN